MNDNLNFYKWFETIASKLGDREISFRKIFKYLDGLPTPIIIVETGCLRVQGDFLDGQSTLLFDKYTLSRGNKSKVYIVDINPNATKVCKETVSNNVEITTENSVRYLNNLYQILYRLYFPKLQIQTILNLIVLIHSNLKNDLQYILS